MRFGFGSATKKSATKHTHTNVARGPIVPLRSRSCHSRLQLIFRSSSNFFLFLSLSSCFESPSACSGGYSSSVSSSDFAFERQSPRSAAAQPISSSLSPAPFESVQLSICRYSAAITLRKLLQLVTRPSFFLCRIITFKSF